MRLFEGALTMALAIAAQALAVGLVITTF